MNAIPRTTNAERAGRWLGRLWRVFDQQEAHANQWLASRGLPAGVAHVLIWIVKLAVFGVLLLTAFWLALVLALVVIAVWLARNTDWESDRPEPEWRNGLAGFGLYTYDEHRIDPHVQDDDY